MKKITMQDTAQVALTLFMVVSLACVAFGVRADETVNNGAARKVQYSDLKPYTQAGAAALYHRIHDAAVAVCGDEDSRRLSEALVAKNCVDRAIYASVVSVNSPMLTSEYRAHFGTVGQQHINVASLR